MEPAPQSPKEEKGILMQLLEWLLKLLGIKLGDGPGLSPEQIKEHLNNPENQQKIANDLAENTMHRTLLSMALNTKIGRNAIKAQLDAHDPEARAAANAVLQDPRLSKWVTSNRKNLEAVGLLTPTQQSTLQGDVVQRYNQRVAQTQAGTTASPQVENKTTPKTPRES